MKKTKTFLMCAGGLLILAGVLLYWAGGAKFKTAGGVQSEKISDYGAFLAAQHAIYVNDFDKAYDFASKIRQTEPLAVQNTKYLAQFLSGRIPDGVVIMAEEKGLAPRLVYDAYLVSKNDWEGLYKRHKNDNSALAAPLRIWSGVAIRHITETMKFIEKLPTNESWKSFVRGQIYAELGKVDKAEAEFAKVRLEFLNISDYAYIMSFYRKNGMTEQAEALYKGFTSRPGGLFMVNFTEVPDWSGYSGLKNALAFSLVQNVSHTQAMMYSDLAILLLRFAQITSGGESSMEDSINYYIGQFFFNNTGNFEKYFANISKDSPYYLFGVLREAEKSGNYSYLEKMLKKNPLFIPAITKLVAHYTKIGQRRASLRVLSRALEHKEINDVARAFLLKNRAQVNYVFGDFNAAQKDIHEASGILPGDAEIMALQAKIWVAQGREIENAYDYAMLLLRKNPTDITSWDTLGRVLAVREGVDAALDILERVGQVSRTCSAVFEQIGDLYLEVGEYDLARDSYLRALDLADDGLVVVPVLQKKLRKIK